MQSAESRVDFLNRRLKKASLKTTTATKVTKEVLESAMPTAPGSGRTSPGEGAALGRRLKEAKSEAG